MSNTGVQTCEELSRPIKLTKDCIWCMVMKFKFIKVKKLWANFVFGLDD